MNFILNVALLIMSLMVMVNGHGRLIDPPSRASMWRFGFKTPPDYNDNQGFCGGFTHQFKVNGGKCGICGDPWDAKVRQHEVGGKYANGIIVADYKAGQEIKALVQITANHRGYFQFKLCPNNNIRKDPKQDCFDRHLLKLADGSGTKYVLKKFTPGEFPVRLKLPEGLVCKQCILQWTYTAGNNWGICKDGKGRLGCGNQEHFRACADISINGEGKQTTNEHLSSPEPTVPVTSAIKSTSKTTVKGNPADVTTTQSSPTVGSGKCVPVGVYAKVPGMGTWCEQVCFHNPPFCPSSFCKCS